MKFNPYAVLLMTGALMVVTVVIAQLGPNSALLRAGAESVDRDVSSFAAKTLTTLDRQSTASPESDADSSDAPTRLASVDQQSDDSQSND